MSGATPKPAAAEPPPPWTVRIVDPGPAAAASSAAAISGLVVAKRVRSADSFWGRFMGLMGRASLPAGEGLYLGGNSIHMFFMRFPIDALFVGGPGAAGTRTVVACRPNLQPWTGLVMPVPGAAGVVELAAGTLERAGVQAGAVIRFEAPVPAAGEPSGDVAA